MLKKDKVYIVIVLLTFFSCKSSNENEKNVIKPKEKSVEILGSKEKYQNVLLTISDTIKTWFVKDYISDTIYDDSPQKNRILVSYILDSTYCINSKKNKIISTVFTLGFQQNKGYNYGLLEFYGVKLKGNWFFWTGGFTPISKDSKHRSFEKPLVYRKLQSFVGYGGYLDKNGNIRDYWFEAKFKGSGWGSFNERYEYKSYLDGNRIDNEKDFWEYKWKRKGLGKYLTKITEDSISKYNLINEPDLTDEQKWEIGHWFCRKILGPYPIYKGKYKS